MDLQYEYDLVCIGSGPAGQRAAIQAAKMGRRVAVVDRSRELGGACLRSATIPSKTFREAVRSLTRETVLRAMSSVGMHRVRPRMQQLLSRVQQVAESEASSVRDAFDRNEVDVLWGLAAFVDQHTIRLESPESTRTVRSSHFLIATGSRSILPQGVRSDGDTVFTSDTILQMAELPRTMTVVGAGVIGIEYASMFAAAGVQVTVLDKADRPVSFVDREIVDELVHQLRSHGVTFRLGEAVKGFEIQDGPPRRGAVVTQSGKRIASDVILISAGRQGNVESLDLETVGIQADERGRLKVDGFFRTSVPTIYAAGDVIGFPGLAATSYEQGRLAAAHMFGEAARPMPEHYPYGIYSIPEISTVGASEEQLTEACVPYEIGVARYAETARGQIRGDEDGLLKLVFHRETRQLLGVHIIGSQATELIHIGQAVLKLGGGLDYFLETVFNYPTYAECYKAAALNARNRLRTGASVDLTPPAAEPPAGAARPDGDSAPPAPSAG